MASQADDKTPGDVCVYEAFPNRAPAAAEDISDELLRRDNWFTDEERARPKLSWLKQSAGHSRRAQRPNSRNAMSGTVSLASATLDAATPQRSFGQTAQDSRSDSGPWIINISADMRDYAATTVGQARKAFDDFINIRPRLPGANQRPPSGPQSIAEDVASRTIDFAEQNANAAFDFAQKLVLAKNLQEAFQLQAEFVRSQFANIQAQAEEFGGFAQIALQQGAENAKTAVQQGAVEARQAFENAATTGRRRTMSEKKDSA